MAKLDLNPISNLQNEVSAVAVINANSVKTEVALENTLSRDGTAPNEMNSDLDMNANRIYNLLEPVSDTEPLRKIDAQEILGLADEFQEAIDATQGAVDAYESIQALYLGSKTTFPTTDNLGGALQEGALFSLVDQADPNDDGLYVWHDSSWGPVGVLPTAFERYEYVLTTAGQTVVNIPGGYTVGTTKAFRNGVLQRIGANLGTDDDDDDVTADNGTTFVFPAAVLDENDIITALISKPYAIVDPALAVDVAFTPTGTIAATNVQTAIAELDSEKVPVTRTVSAGGIATGGGDLSADRTITVTKSSNAQAIAGVDDTTAMTPLRVSEAITAAGGSPALALVASGTTGAVATLDIPLTGGYRKYKVFVSDFEPETANQALLARISVDGGATYISTSNYATAGQYTDTTPATAIWATTAGTSFFVGRSQPVPGYGSLLEFTIGMGTATSPTNVNWSFSHAFTGGVFTGLTASGRHIGVLAPTHIRFVYVSGNIAAGARWELYGLRN